MTYSWYVTFPVGSFMSSGFFQKVRRRFSGRAYGSTRFLQHLGPRVQLVYPFCVAISLVATGHRFTNQQPAAHRPGLVPLPLSIARAPRSSTSRAVLRSRWPKSPAKFQAQTMPRTASAKATGSLWAEKEMRRKSMDLIKKDGDNNQCFIVWGFEHRNITKCLAKWAGFTKFTKYRSTSSWAGMGALRSPYILQVQHYLHTITRNIPPRIWIVLYDI